jgi:hypothetical protein
MSPIFIFTSSNAGHFYPADIHCEYKKGFRILLCFSSAMSFFSSLNTRYKSLLKMIKKRRLSLAG